MCQARWIPAVTLLTLLVLPSTPALADWDLGDDFKMHFPQLPDPTGWDVSASVPSAIADDWQCSQSGYVSDIHIWGSWYMDMPSPILNFRLEIWSDQPADPPGIPFSRPQALLWAHDFPAGTFIERPYGIPSLQGFFDPFNGIVEPANHLNTFQYNFSVPEGEAFIQEEGTIYWLVVQVALDGPPVWGWKTSRDHWNDDSVYIDPTGAWQELFDPFEPGLSLDQAFVITGEPLADWGDAPDPNYPTLTPSNGANHTLGGALMLGATVDGEPDGQPDSTATGDDNDGNNDDDGVVFQSPLVLGKTTLLTVTVTAGCAISAWIDLNGDGDWLDAMETLYSGIPLSAGANVVPLGVPAGAVPGSTFIRFRVTTSGALPFTGNAPDGEVEDYEVFIEEPLEDWGDAPDPFYPVLSSSNGAVHTLVESVYIGASAPDGETNGQPQATALGDDNDGYDDEDGVVHSPGTIVPGATVYVTVTASTSGFINAWVDFNADGDWTDAGEQVFIDVAVVAGANALSFTAPAGVVTPTFARYRFDTNGGLTDVGPAADGEVEDYYLEAPIFIDGFESSDTSAWSNTVGGSP